MVDTRIKLATSATVKNRARAWDSTLPPLLRACWHCTPLWHVRKVSGIPLRAAQLAGALGRRLHGFDEGAAHAFGLEDPQAGRRRASRRGHRRPVLLGRL